MTAHSTLSMLDLVAVREGGSVRDALAIALATARHAEALGFTRYWLAEHHNMEGIASSATAVLVGHIAAGTQTLRVGSGGVMLPNHAPLVVAEAFGTLAELFPGRIDLGLGRAPGTDPLTMRALRRDRQETEQDFPRDVAELQRLLAPAQPGQRLIATPGAGTQVPIWLLGSSLFSAQLAAERGLPYAFASHFAPRLLLQAMICIEIAQASAEWLSLCRDWVLIAYRRKHSFSPAAPFNACGILKASGANWPRQSTAWPSSYCRRNAPPSTTFWRRPSSAGTRPCARVLRRCCRPRRPTS
jgi:hypothetical protein